MRKWFLMSKLIGYARVSREDQELNLQIDALKKAGCLKQDIYIDKVSGAREKRPGLDECLSKLQPGDTLLVWRLDRLGRSLPHLVDLVSNLLEKKIGFKSICDGHIDTTSASGELMFNIFSSLAQFERRLIQERTKAGLEAARARGRKGGRKPIDPYSPKVLAAKKLYQEKNISVQEICQRLNLTRPTFYRYLTK